MSVCALVHCEGAWDAGRFPCRAFLPLPATLATWPEIARHHAAEHGWTRDPDGRDLCPACTGRQARAA